MRKLRRSVTIFFLLGGGALSAAQQGGMPSTPPPPFPTLTLTSPGFSDGGTVPDKYTCKAGPAQVSPQLQWTEAPKGAASYALILHDPDVNPRNLAEDVTHWVIFNIPASTMQLPEGVKDGPQADGTMPGKNVFGNTRYLGPCAPPGPAHHYLFELYVLDKKLDLAQGASRSDLLKAMDGHIIGKGVLVGKFNR